MTRPAEASKNLLELTPISPGASLLLAAFSLVSGTGHVGGGPDGSLQRSATTGAARELSTWVVVVVVWSVWRSGSLRAAQRHESMSMR